MFKFYSRIIGENPEYTASFQPSSKRKIVLLACCLMVPVMLWFIGTYLLVYNVMNGSFLNSALAAIIAGLIIFFIERAIIMSNGNGWVVLFRILMGFAVAFLGATIYDQVIFNGDIDQQMAVYKNEYVDTAVKDVENEYVDRIESQKSNVNFRYHQWDSAYSEVSKEADGTGGSKKALIGNITFLKQDAANHYYSEYQSSLKELSNLEVSLDSAKKVASTKANSEFNNRALLKRIHAMFDLIKSDPYMRTNYIVFTSLLFFMEFLVVIIKLTSRKSYDEQLEEIREKLMMNKIERIVEKDAAVFKPENRLPIVRKATASIGRDMLNIF